jgi:hypothetical protein
MGKTHFFKLEIALKSQVCVNSGQKKKSVVKSVDSWARKATVPFL